jgi:hypothetical protein
VLRAASIILGLLFLLGAGVQFNDPDPFNWVVIYLAASVASFGRAMGRLPRAVPAVVGLIALAWAATLAPQVLGRGEFTSMFGAWEMANTGIEISREFWGLVVIAGWMAALTAFPRPSRVHRYRSR